MSHHEDYKAKIKGDKQRRLEKVSLAILEGMAANGFVRNDNDNDNKQRIVAVSVELAKEFIKQMDQEEF